MGKGEKMQQSPKLPKQKRVLFNKEAFLKAAEKVEKVIQKEEQKKAPSGNV